MAEGQMLKDLPQECLLNVSSFLLGTPQQLKLKNNKALKQIQSKYKLDVCEFSEDEYIRTVDESDYEEEEEQRELRYGYDINFMKRDYTIEEITRITKRQCHKLKSMVKPDGDTHLKFTFNYYLDGEEQSIRCRIEDIDYTTIEELLEYVSMKTQPFHRMINGYIALGHQVKFKSVVFQLLNITPSVYWKLIIEPSW